jgi:uncharacterized membrane protein YqaE (UPF0057 family)
MSAAIHARRPGIGAVVAAILLPPLGAWLVRGLGPAFWITLLLTCVAFVPGMVFALVLILVPNLLPAHRFG